MEMSGQLHTPAALPPGKGIGGWLGFRVSLDAVEKKKIFCPCRESNSGRPACSLSVSQLHNIMHMFKNGNVNDETVVLCENNEITN
jgi:hypothetical protein